MKKKILILAGLLFAGALAPRPAAAQSQTQVTACITDPNSIPYAGGQVLINLVPTGGPAPTVNNGPIQGTFGPTPLDANGCFQASLWPNASISPGGTKWQFTVSNPGAAAPVGFGPVSFTAAPITIAGSTQNITSQLTAAAVQLWHDGGAAGSTAFSAITTGVNVGHVLTVGAGSTLTFSGGGVINASECNGAPCGTGAGFGFATGAIVANSTGNTPTNGFTLDAGNGDTNANSPSEITLSSTGNPGVIQLNSEANPTLSVGNAATVGASTKFSNLIPANLNLTDASGDTANYGTAVGGSASEFKLTASGGNTITCDASSNQCIWADPGAGSSATASSLTGFTIVDASGNAGELGAPNGAGLTLNGPGGISIVCDGTVPSCNWDDGAGDQVTISPQVMQFQDSAGLTIETGFTSATQSAFELDGTGGKVALLSLDNTAGAAELQLNGTGASTGQLFLSSGSSGAAVQFFGTTSGAALLEGPAAVTANTVLVLPNTGATRTLAAISGTPTTGDCTSWASAVLVQDAGGPCPGLSNVAAHTVFSNNTGSSALPTFNTSLSLLANGTHPANGVGLFQDNETTAAATSVGAFTTLTDAAGSTVQEIGTFASAIIQGSNVAGDLAQGLFAQGEDISSGGAAAQVSAIEAQFTCTSRTVLCAGIDINTVGGTAGVTTAGLNIKNQGSGNFSVLAGTGKVQFGGLSSGGTQCVQASSAGLLSVTGSGCGTTLTIASGTAAMGTSAISSGTCATVVTVAGAGIATTDTVDYVPNGDPTGVTGYAPSASGSLYIWGYPTSGNANFKVCNNTAGSITPGALTLNWRVTR